MIGNRYNSNESMICECVFALTVQCSCDWKCLPFLFAVLFLRNVDRINVISYHSTAVSALPSLYFFIFCYFGYKNFHWWYFIRIKRFILSGVIAILILNLLLCRWRCCCGFFLFILDAFCVCIIQTIYLLSRWIFAWLLCIPLSFALLFL